MLWCWSGIEKKRPVEELDTLVYTQVTRHLIDKSMPTAYWCAHPSNSDAVMHQLFQLASRLRFLNPFFLLSMLGIYNIWRTYRICLALLFRKWLRICFYRLWASFCRLLVAKRDLVAYLWRLFVFSIIISILVLNWPCATIE